MKSKFKIYLTSEVFAILTLNLEIPSQQKMLAEALGIGEQEQVNLIGQKTQELLQLLGNSDEA